MLAIGHLRHQSATTRSLATHAADAVLSNTSAINYRYRIVYVKMHAVTQVKGWTFFETQCIFKHKTGSVFRAAEAHQCGEWQLNRISSADVEFVVK